MFQPVGEIAVFHMARADALVQILCGQIILQHTHGARVAVLAAQAVKQGAAALVERIDDGGVFHCQRHFFAGQIIGFVGVEKLRFHHHQFTQLAPSPCHVFLHRPVRQQQMQHQRAQAVKHGAAHNHQRINIPWNVRQIGEHGVHHHQQGAKGNGAVAHIQRPGHGNGEGGGGHQGGKQPRLLHGELHQQRGRRKMQQGKKHIA